VRIRHPPNSVLPTPAKRYVFAVVTVIAAWGLRKLLEPVTGTGAPFVLFFGAVLVASLLGGRGPGILATLLSLPLGTYEFVVRAGYPLSQALPQAGLFAIDCLVVTYMSSLTRRSEAHTRELIDLAPDAFFLADLEGRYLEVNQAACRMLGYARDELVGKRILDLVPAEDARRLATERSAMLASKRPITSEWTLKRKDGTLLPVEVSANIIADGRWQAFVRDISERRRRDDERRVFVSLLENSSDFIGIADPNGRPIYLNPAGRRMVGLSPDYPVEQTRIPDYYPPEERKFAMEVIVKSMIEHGHWSGETFFRHWQTGEAIPVSDEHFMIRDPTDGRILGMGTVTRDITEARRAREQLRASEARFAGIISISTDAIISIGENQRITLFNTGAERTFGYSQAEMIGAPLDLLLPERLQDLHRRHIAGFAAGPVTARQMGERAVTIVGRRKNGEEFPAEAAISKLDIGGSTILTVALRDITARKRIEKEQRFLSESGAVLAASLDYEQTLVNVGQLIVRDLADWCIVEIVEGEEQIRRLKVVSADPSKASLAAQLEQFPIDRSRPYFTRLALESRGPFALERITASDLEAFAQNAEHLRLLHAIDPKSAMGLPLLIRGRLLGALYFISSTSSRLYGQSDLQFAQALAKGAALAIDNGHLYQTAVQATQLRDEVLRVVAHDLRNPLSVILMQSAAALRRGGPEPERRNQRSNENIQRAATRMKRLIQDLLDVTLIEARQLRVDRVRVPARQLLLEAVEAQRPLAASAALDVRCDLDCELPDIWGDPHRLLQVFENLISNAIKFTPAGGQITISATPGERDVEFRVADTGGGIAASDLPHVFDRFWQARKGAHGGAGLGLPITRGIVEAHGGRIWVESTLGRGTTLSFTIPRADGLSGMGPTKDDSGEPNIHPVAA
jgi:PAS domain S-box-containing protein